MKDWEELEDMTVWDVTTNEGSLTLLILGLACLVLSAMYLIIGAYFKVKFMLKRIWGYGHQST